MNYLTKEFTPSSGRGNNKQKVFICLITNPNQVLNKNINPILNAMRTSSLSNAIGIYFYRFKDITTYNAFTKIGEVSRIEGIETRFKRGWHGTNKYGDTYLEKKINNDINNITEANPMYFVFYQFDLLESYPKIDEQISFLNHLNHFNTSPRNSERPNSNYQVGTNLVWHSSAFDEVLNLCFPDGTNYPF